MGRWKLATILLATAFAIAISCLIAAAQVWEYAYPRSMFVNSAFFFSAAALVFLVVVLFLDDVSEWIAERRAGFTRSLMSLTFALSFSVLMIAGLYLGAIGGRSLAGLSVCGFDSVDAICLKKQTELSDDELKGMKKDLNYHLTFGSHPAVVKILQYSQVNLDNTE